MKIADPWWHGLFRNMPHFRGLRHMWARSFVKVRLVVGLVPKRYKRKFNSTWERKRNIISDKQILMAYHHFQYEWHKHTSQACCKIVCEIKECLGLRLTLGPQNKLSSAKLLVCFNFQSVSRSPKVGENVIWVLNSLDLGETPNCYLHMGLQ